MDRHPEGCSSHVIWEAGAALFALLQLEDVSGHKGWLDSRKYIDPRAVVTREEEDERMEQTGDGDSEAQISRWKIKKSWRCNIQHKIMSIILQQYYMETDDY